MTKNEALRMAIEIMQRYLKETPLGNQPHMIAHKAEEAIQACKDALAQPADGIESEWYCKGWDDAEKDLATQEPVGEINTNGMAWFYSKELSPKYGTKLYTTPPSREWVGLSDDEIEEVFNLGHKNFKEFAHAIEAKLREKNNG